MTCRETATGPQIALPGDVEIRVLPEGRGRPERGAQTSGSRSLIVVKSGGVRRELVGDGPGVAGHAGRLNVSLFDEQGEGAGDPGRGRGVEGHGDQAGRTGDRAAEVEQVAGDGPVFVSPLAELPLGTLDATMQPA